MIHTAVKLFIIDIIIFFVYDQTRIIVLGYTDKQNRDSGGWKWL